MNPRTLCCDISSQVINIIWVSREEQHSLSLRKTKYTYCLIFWALCVEGITRLATGKTQVLVRGEVPWKRATVIWLCFWALTFSTKTIPMVPRILTTANLCQRVTECPDHILQHSYKHYLKVLWLMFGCIRLTAVSDVNCPIPHIKINLHKTCSVGKFQSPARKAATTADSPWATTEQPPSENSVSMWLNT